jgi:hypothetical protein
MLRSAKAKPMEMERLNVPDDAVHNWFTTLHDGISGTPAHFVYNMDEMGHQEYADAAQIQSNALCPRTSLICRTMKSPVAARGPH